MGIYMYFWFWRVFFSSSKSAISIEGRVFPRQKLPLRLKGGFFCSWKTDVSIEGRFLCHGFFPMGNYMYFWFWRVFFIVKIGHFDWRACFSSSKITVAIEGSFFAREKLTFQLKGVFCVTAFFPMGIYMYFWFWRVFFSSSKSAILIEGRVFPRQKLPLRLKGVFLLVKNWRFNWRAFFVSLFFPKGIFIYFWFWRVFFSSSKSAISIEGRFHAR